jgi:hypothetical protein
MERGEHRPNPEEVDVEANLQGQEQPKDPDKRKFLRRAAMLGGGALLFGGGALVREILKPESGKRFKEGVEGFKIVYGELRRNQVLFVNENDGPIGEPIELLPYNGITPGEFDAHGFIIGSINPEWLTAQRQRICAQDKSLRCDLAHELPKQRNVIALLRQAVEEEGLQVETYLDVVKHYGKQRVVGAEEYDRIKYVRKYLARNTDLPQAVIEELARVGPGLAAQESRFDNASVSKAGARGIFQFMPDTFEGLGYTEADYSSLVAQVEAAGKYFKGAFRALDQRAHDSLTLIRYLYFENDEDFAKEFLVPVLVNSYNAGAARMAAVISWFTYKYPDRKTLTEAKDGFEPRGYDVFKIMSMEAREENSVPLVAGYGSDASGYVPRIYAFADLLKH